MNASAFWDHVAIPELPDDETITHCWPWTAGRNKDGYGTLRLDGKTVYAFHVAYELFWGPLAPGLCRRHLCNNRACCNPFHLLPGTHLENMQDALQSGSLGKLTPAQVMAIRARRAAGESSTALAAEYHIHPGRIRHLCARQPDTWKHLPEEAA